MSWSTGSWARRGRNEAARSGLEAALGLWRGEVLSGLSGRDFAAAAAHWREKRLTVVEDGAEAGRECGLTMVQRETLFMLVDLELDRGDPVAAQRVLQRA